MRNALCVGAKIILLSDACDKHQDYDILEATSVWLHRDNELGEIAQMYDTSKCHEKKSVDSTRHDWGFSEVSSN